MSIQPSHVPVILGIANESLCSDDLLLPLCAATLCGGTGGEGEQCPEIQHLLKAFPVRNMTSGSTQRTEGCAGTGRAFLSNQSDIASSDH